MLERYPGLYHKGGGIHCITDGALISTTKLQPTLRTVLPTGSTIKPESIEVCGFWLFYFVETEPTSRPAYKVG